ncbi:MAG: hypothetical protein ACI9VO_000469 [Colwellia sp.]|jgi:hypothetical protein
MRKLITLSASIIVLLSATAMANSGLDRAKVKFLKYTEANIVVLNEFKACIQTAKISADIRLCSQEKSTTMKKLRADRTKK